MVNKERLSANYGAELIAKGFTIIPYGVRSADSCFFDKYVLNYTVCPFREVDTVIGRYSVDKGNETEAAGKGRVEFEVIYGVANPNNILHAASLRSVLKQLGVAFSENPTEEERRKLAGALETSLK